MSQRPPAWEYEQRRQSRIRQLREQREGPMRRRRRVEPLLIVAWLAGSIALVAVLLVLGFMTIFAPRVMAWVEANPGAIEHGVVQDFVEWYRPEALGDEPAGTERRRITVEIPEGVTDAEIGQLLLDASVINNRLAFQYQVIQSERSGTLAAGVYDLSPTMRPSQIIATLIGEAFVETEVIILEGLRLEEVVAALGNTDLTMNLEAFADLVRNPPAELLNQYDFLIDLPAGRSLEGYLFPDTYRLEVSSNPEEILNVLLTTFGTQLTPEIRAAIAARGLSIDDAVILASIVEREAVIAEERPLIAGVFLNRINNPQGETAGLLNADPTIQYGQATFEYLIQQQLVVDQWGLASWWPQLQVSAGELGTDWPEELIGFQTYLIPGLPPTPIAAPRIESIAAVANAATDAGYLYFVAACPNGVRDGSHYFASTLADHNANIARANTECAGA
ncbi:MAG: endolytic transglycosylase MltG [Candidatus Limnocylindria bacterium]